MRNLILVPALLFIGSSATQGQRWSGRSAMTNVDRPSTAIRVQPVSQEIDDTLTGKLRGGGFAGALVMTVAGGYLGYHAGGHCGDGMCELGGLLIGALVGEVLGVPLGVQMAGGGGSFVAQILVSAGVAALGGIAIPVTAGLSLLAVVPIQIELVIQNAKGGTTRTEAPR